MIKHSLLRSFISAWNGIYQTVKQERNIKIHIVAALLVLYFAWYKELQTWRVAVLFLTISSVIVAEIFNSALERVVDLTVNKQFHPLAREAKDMAAGAVLMTAFTAILVGAVVFLY